MGSGGALLAVAMAGMLATAMGRSLLEFSDQKNFYFPPDPHAVTGSPPYTAAPAQGSGSYSGSPYHSTPAATPATPSVPTYSTPAPTTGTCTYWATHPQAITGIFGLGTISQCFGITCVTVFGWDPTLHDALTNSRADGYGALLREGTAAYLNSVAGKNFPLTAQQVKHSFVSAITSDGAAAAQAELFKAANEGKLKL